MKQPKKNSSARQEHRIRFSDDLIWGIHPVLQALQSGPTRITEVVLQKSKRGPVWDEIIDSARRADIKCLFVESIKMSGNDGAQIKHQGVVARGAAVGLVSLDEMLSKF
ncbi:MAG: 23S rRNA (guanosine(2251)-2'-O)-methyltransferase RlmB, partial [Desulfobacterales bacterium]|nr:23S rRNA (guanosine(2251)-2'-O)-methyltransferase RlmB [Desulfobacterales bacterium]